LAAVTTPTLAWAGAVKSVSLDKAFPYLQAFLTYPADKRTRFYIAFVARRGMKPAPDFRAMIVGPGAQRTPLALGPDGRVMRLPTLAELRGGATLDCDAAAGDVKLALELRPAAAAATHVDPADLDLSLAQANAAAATIAGVLSFAVPKLDTVYFPGAGGGQAVFAGGRAAPLPTTVSPTAGQIPYFESDRSAGARDVVLAKAPSRMLIGPHPKT
jgi:hypothetical protein